MSANRQNIIDATDHLIQTAGLARLTMRAVAKQAKVAEGLIYHHFKDKAELIYEVVESRIGDSRNLLQNLPLKVGTQSLAKILEDTLCAVYHVHYEIILLVCSIFTDQLLRVRMQEIMTERNIGPQRTIEGLRVFLAAEQRIGRLSDAVDPQSAARCLWLMTIQSAMEDRLMDRSPDETTVRQDIRKHLETLMKGLAPLRPAETTPPN